MEVSTVTISRGMMRYMVITMRFSAEAVQLGNVASAIGMGGIWTVAEHEDSKRLLCCTVRNSRSLKFYI